MAVESTGRIEVPALGSVDVYFDNQGNIFGFQIHTTVAMQFSGVGFSPDLNQSGPGLLLKRATAGVVQADFTEVDGIYYINTAPIPFYRKSGTHKIHIYNGSQGAGYFTIVAITGQPSQPAYHGG